MFKPQSRTKKFDHRTKAKVDRLTSELIELPERPNGGRRYLRLEHRRDPKLSCEHEWRTVRYELADTTHKCWKCRSEAVFNDEGKLEEFVSYSLLQEEEKRAVRA